MSMRWKITNKVQAVRGWVRQRFGRVSGNRSQQAEGKTDRVAGNLKQSAEKVKDAFKR
ncbi:CsbD family protein [Nonomuraea sp. LPB2021202275-12-8]|uniref:CsbD family protein n=1 Tax=Nonomuraea sp. LPB2021202275-12-8 TaxID=3120159 RepID=UPI00300CB733